MNHSIILVGVMDRIPFIEQLGAPLLQLKSLMSGEEPDQYVRHEKQQQLNEQDSAVQILNILAEQFVASNRISDFKELVASPGWTFAFSNPDLINWERLIRMGLYTASDNLVTELLESWLKSSHKRGANYYASVDIGIRFDLSGKGLLEQIVTQAITRNLPNTLTWISDHIFKSDPSKWIDLALSSPRLFPTILLPQVNSVEFWDEYCLKLEGLPDQFYELYNRERSFHVARQNQLQAKMVITVLSLFNRLPENIRESYRPRFLKLFQTNILDYKERIFFHFELDDAEDPLVVLLADLAHSDLLRIGDCFHDPDRKTPSSFLDVFNLNPELRLRLFEPILLKNVVKNAPPGQKKRI